MAFAYTDYPAGLRLVFHDAQDPTDAEWETVLESLRKLPAPRLRTLVISDGGSPSLKQRKILDAVIAEKKVPAKTSLVTSSAAMRAVISAVSWISKNHFKCYKPAELVEAMHFIDCTNDEISTLQQDIDAASAKYNLKLFAHLSKRAG